MPHNANTDPEYGPVFAVLTPQANTTVEPEMQLLLPGTVLTARCTGTGADSRQRLLDYIDRIDATLNCFDTAPIRAAGFACTGSSYLIGRSEEDRRFAELEAQRRYPIISATQAIRRSFDVLGAKRITLVSPYPEWLTEAALAYWRDAGYAIAAVLELTSDVADTRNIYKLDSARVAKILEHVDARSCDAVLLSGTGMPTLQAIAGNSFGLASGPALLSSNLCLAWAMQAAAQSGLATREALLEFAGVKATWRQRLVSRQES